jgi:hypothetical protein
MLYQEKKGNDTFGTTYASYVTKMDMYLKNVQTGSCTKEDSVGKAAAQDIGLSE